MEPSSNRRSGHASQRPKLPRMHSSFETAGSKPFSSLWKSDHRALFICLGTHQGGHDPPYFDWSLMCGKPDRSMNQLIQHRITQLDEDEGGNTNAYRYERVPRDTMGNTPELMCLLGLEVLFSLKDEIRLEKVLPHVPITPGSGDFTKQWVQDALKELERDGAIQMRPIAGGWKFIWGEINYATFNFVKDVMGDDRVQYGASQEARRSPGRVHIQLPLFKLQKGRQPPLPPEMRPKTWYNKWTNSRTHNV